MFREGKFGRFIGCEKYPDCDFVKNISLGLNCPKCKEGSVVERKTKRKRLFYGCSRYPDCDFISWYKPVPEACPHNGQSLYGTEIFTEEREISEMP